MTISAISKMLPSINTSNPIEKSGTEKFGNILSNFIGDVNQSQIDANNMTKEYIEGGKVQIQDVMIAGEKAQTSLDLLMEIRNKAIDTYNELTRMQI